MYASAEYSGSANSGKNHIVGNSGLPVMGLFRAFIHADAPG